jgi:hypothetical protein
MCPVRSVTYVSGRSLAQKSKEMFAEAQEHVHDIMAEVKAEDEAAASAKESETNEPPNKDRHAA